MKKAQVTLFIIIGILILATIVFLILITQKEAREEFEVKRPSVAQIPSEVQPVYDQVRQCIYDTAKEGVKILGAKGGYIERQFSSNPFQPTESDAVSFPDQGLVVPYWYHMSSSNNCRSECEFRTNVPDLFASAGYYSVESQLARYVNANVRRCLDITDFGAFDVVELSPPELEVTVTPEDVFVSGEYNIRASRDETTDFSEWYVPLDVNLFEAFKLGIEVVEVQSNNSLIEGATTDIISAYSGLDSEKLPPLYDFRLSYKAPHYWIEYEAQDTLERLLASHTSMFRAAGTNNFRYVLPEGDHPAIFDAAVNRQFLLPLEGSYPDYDLKLAYLPWWNTYFDLNCMGQLCTADTVSMPFSFLIGMQQYKFQYDISYPVLVTMTDDGAFNGEGFTLQFFVEANVRNNQPLKGATILPAVTPPSAANLFCSPDQWHSGEFTINVRDRVSGQPVDDVSLTLTCGDQTCMIGDTSAGKLVTKLPKCVGAVLTATKQDYLQAMDMIITDTDEEESVTLQMYPKKKVSASAKRYLLLKEGRHAPWKVKSAGPPSMMDTDEFALVILKRKKQTPYDEPFTAIANIGEGDSIVELVPGEYTVRVDAFKYPDNVTIPRDRRCQQVGDGVLDPFFEDQCYYLPDKPIVFDDENPLAYGSTEYDIEISASDLRNANNIEFRYVGFGLDKVPERMRVIEDLDEYSKIEMYARALKSKLQPVIS